MRNHKTAVVNPHINAGIGIDHLIGVAEQTLTDLGPIGAIRQANRILGREQVLELAGVLTDAKRSYKGYCRYKALQAKTLDEACAWATLIVARTTTVRAICCGRETISEVSRPRRGRTERRPRQKRLRGGSATFGPDLVLPAPWQVALAQLVI